MAEQVEFSTTQVQAQIQGLIDKIKLTGTSANMTEKEIKQVTSALEQTGSKGTKSLNDVNQGMGNLANSAKNLAAGFGIAFGTAQLVDFGAKLIDVSRKYQALQTAIDFTTGSAIEGRFAFQFVSDTANKLGLNLAASAEGFKQISGASRGTVLAGQATRDIFEGVSMAASRMKLSADNTTGALLAISQMISKGKVSAEELRGQLGERLPGAMQIFARSLGVTTQQLDKMLEQGQVLATDALPKFAEQLKKEFGNGENAAEGLGASMERLGNNWEEFMFRLASTDGGAFGKIINFLTEQVKDLNKALAGEEGAALENATKLFKELGNTDNVDELAGKIAILQQVNSNLKDGFEELNDEIILNQNALNESLFPSSKLEKHIESLNDKLSKTRVEYSSNETAIGLLTGKINELNTAKTTQNTLTQAQIDKLKKEREEAEKLLETLRIKAQVELAGGKDSAGGLEILENQEQKELAALIEKTKKAKKLEQLSQEEIEALKGQVRKEFDEKRFKVLENELEKERKLVQQNIIESGLDSQKQQSLGIVAENNYLQDKKVLYEKYGKGVSEIVKGIDDNGNKEIANSVSILETELQKKLLLIEENALAQKKINQQIAKDALDLAKSPKERNKAIEVAKSVESGLDSSTENQKIRAKIAELEAEKDLLDAKKENYAKYAIDILKVEQELAAQKSALWNNEKSEFDRKEEEKTKKVALEAENRKKLESAAIDGLQSIAGSAMQIARNNREGELQELEEEQARKLKLAGDNEAKKAAINAEFEGKKRQQKRETAVQEKIFAGFEVVLNTAASIVKTGATLGYPLAIPFQVIAGAVGLAQLAVIASQPLPKFEKGVIDFKGKKGDVNPVLISGGESVITELGTRNAPKTLEQINKGLWKDGQTPKQIAQFNEIKSLKSFDNLGKNLGTSSFDYQKLATEITNGISQANKNLPQTKFVWNERGVSKWVQNGLNETEYLGDTLNW